MDIELARTFLAIVEAGSFVRAAERLNVTQTTVSARVRSLEDQLRRPVFLRNKAGVTLTAAGEQFLRFAPTLVQVWERARHQVAVPAGRRAVLAMGGELTLWNPLLLNWMVWMRRNAPDIALQTQVGLSDGLLRQVADGVLDLAVVYSPRQWPGLQVEMLTEEKLVLVTTDPSTAGVSDPDYVYVDWGADFAAHHGLNFPAVLQPRPVHRPGAARVGLHRAGRWNRLLPETRGPALPCQRPPAPGSACPGIPAPGLCGLPGGC